MRLPWSSVVLSSVCVAAVTVLSLAHVDQTAILTVIVPILGAIIYGRVSEIKTSVNGNTQELMAQIRRQSELLAMMTLPPEYRPVDDAADPPSTGRHGDPWSR